MTKRSAAAAAFLILLVGCMFAAPAQGATTMAPKQHAVYVLAGADSAGNTASVTYASCDIDNHVLGYCVKDPNHANQVYVVSRGGAGNFTLTVTATNSGGATLTTTAAFTVVAGPASTFALNTVTPPSDPSIDVPSLPSGW